MQGPADRGSIGREKSSGGRGPGGFPQQQGQLPGVVGDGRTGRQDGVQVQLSADHVAGVAQHSRASTRRADYGGGAKDAGAFAFNGGFPVLGFHGNGLAFSTALAGMVKLSAL